MFSFSKALAEVKAGGRVTRLGWNGKGMFIFLVPGSIIEVSADRPLGQALPGKVGEMVAYRPHIDMKTVDDEIVPWIATQSDLLAEDWVMFESTGY